MKFAMTAEEKQFIERQYKQGKVVLATPCGLASCDMEELVGQPVEGLLYDLNRDELTTYTLNNERAINDIAVAKVIRHLHGKVYGKPNKN